MIAGGENVVVQRGCLALQNEDEYKCEVKTVGSHVGKTRKVCLKKLYVFRPTHTVTATGMVVTRIGTPRQAQL